MYNRLARTAGLPVMVTNGSHHNIHITDLSMVTGEHSFSTTEPKVTYSYRCQGSSLSMVYTDPVDFTGTSRLSLSLIIEDYLQRSVTKVTLSGIHVLGPR